MSKWLTESPKVHRTWNRLAGAVETIGNTAIAEAIRENSKIILNLQTLMFCPYHAVADLVSQLLQKYRHKFSNVVIPEKGVHLLVTEKVLNFDEAANMKKCVPMVAY